MAQPVAFGHPKDVTGKAGTFKSTLVPLELLGHVLTRPISITNSGTSNRTFTVAASVSDPVYIWDGRDFIPLKENLSYTWSTAANDILATSGALASAQVPGAVGIRYFYAGLDSTGTLGLYPSTVQPSHVEGPFPGTVLGHPGVARTRIWRYVGFQFMSATTPVFDYFVKRGYTYHVSNHAYAGVDTQPGAVTLSVVPGHNGVRIGGFVTGAVSQAVELGVATDATLTNAVVGAWKAMVGGVSAAAIGQPYGPFENLEVTSAGDIVAHIDPTATTVNIIVTRIHDVV